jgi:hypothetical protein
MPDAFALDHLDALLLDRRLVQGFDDDSPMDAPHSAGLKA